MSAFVIGLFDPDNPMAIPYVVCVRHLIDIPSLYMIFINQNNFWVAIAGYYMQQLFAKGWTAPALLMLKSVVDKEVSSLSIGIFLFTVNIDYSFALGAAGTVKTEQNLSHDRPAEYGFWVGILCIIPVVMAIPIFYLAGIMAKRRNQDKIK